MIKNPTLGTAYPSLPWREGWSRQIERLIGVSSADPAQRRRGQLLATFILMLSVILLYTTVESAVFSVLKRSHEYTIYVLQDVFAGALVYFFWRLNRSGYTRIAAYGLFSILILFTTLATQPEYFEYLMIFFALPVMVSSFVLQPGCSFLFASLTVSAYAVVSAFAGYLWDYNLTAALSLFAVATTSWIISSKLEETFNRNENLYTELKASNQKLIEAYEATLEGWSRALELRDKETQGHTLRVTELTLRTARAMGLTQDEILHIRRGALLHDIGKLGIPDEILHKPGPLTGSEWEAMQRHPQFAYDMISPIEYLHPARDIPYCHHEKWDGTGYPRGLKGGEIPLAARIFAVADVYDALTSTRPYREAWAKEKALEYIRQVSGTHFDPRVVNVFIREVVGE
jgi:hypothetical protein